MKLRTLLMSFCLILWSIGGTAHAVVLFENGPYPAPNTTSAWCSACGNSYRVWDSFTLSADAQIESINADLFVSNVASINYSIWTADRSTELFSQTFAIGDLTLVSQGGNSYNVTAQITGLNLQAGTYYLSIYDPTLSSTLAWYALAIAIDGSGYQSAGAAPLPLSGGGTGKDFAFRIDGSYDVSTVPVPAALPLFASGLAGMWLVNAVRRCRSRSA